jgi:hypothetical protein
MIQCQIEYLSSAIGEIDTLDMYILHMCVR